MSLACNQASGINSIIGYNTTILIQAGLSDKHAHQGSLAFNFVNFLATIGAVLLVDRKGRKFLLSLGSAGIIISLICAGSVFNQTEKQRVDTTIAATFLPSVGKYGYSTMFFVFAGCTVVYFITAAFFLPETKGRTLEKIEQHFEGKKQ